MTYLGLLVGIVVKNLPASAGETKDSGSIPESGRSPEEGNSNPLQYSCLGNPTDRGAWWAIVQGVSESDTTEHACILYTQAHVLFLGNFSVGTIASGLRN